MTLRSVRSSHPPSLLPPNPPSIGSADTAERESSFAHTTTVPLEPSPTGTPQPISGEVVSSRRADLPPGARAGDYEIVSWLSGGGFGQVYRARHVGTGEARAIKVLHADLAGTRASILRFSREIEAIGRMDHPNVVRIGVFGQLPDGRPWFAMELLRGEDLASRITSAGRLSPEEALRIMEPLASALEAVHARGIVHRDLKPSNVFLDEGALPARGDAPSEPRVVLLDFGVARILDDSGPGLTASLQVLGTPTFMAPEQIRGQPASASADVYAFGAIVYTMLTGEPPFSTAHDALGLLQLHLYARPPRVSSRAPVPAALDDVVLRALAKQPEKRYSGARAFVDAFRDALSASRKDAAPGASEAQTRTLALHVSVTLQDASLDDPDDQLLARLDALLPRAAEMVTPRGFRPALQLGEAALYLVDLPSGEEQSTEGRASAIEGALALHEDLCLGPFGDERIEVHVALHCAKGSNEYKESALLDAAAWVPDPPPKGVWASDEVLAGTRFKGGQRAGLLLRVERD